LNAGLLCQMPSQEGNERSEASNHEKRKAGNTGYMSLMWHQDVQNREELSLQLKKGWMYLRQVALAFLATGESDLPFLPG
jgi:hypothetical protein